VYLGLSHLLDRHPEQAAQALEQCTEMAPEDPTAWLQLSEARVQGGDRRGAADAAETALALGEKSFRRRRSVAQLLYQAGHRRRALQVAAETARLTPSLRAVLLPITLPLQVASRALRMLLASLVVALFVLGLRGTSLDSPRWWALIPAVTLVTLFALANYSSEALVQWRRWNRFAAARVQLRRELQPE